MPALHSPRPIRPAMGRTNRDSPGFSVRATAISAPAETVAGRPPSGDAPRKPSDRYWAGQLSSMAFRTASVLVPPLLAHWTVWVQKVPAPTLPGMRSEASKPIPAAVLAMSAATVSLEAPAYQSAGVVELAEMALPARIQFWMPDGVARNSATARTSGLSTSTMSVSAEPSTFFWAGSIVGNGKIPTSVPRMYLDGWLLAR